MTRCYEDGCRNPISKRKPESGLCDACLNLAEMDEVDDRQRLSFDKELLRMLRKGNYDGLLDLIAGPTRH